MATVVPAPIDFVDAADVSTYMGKSVPDDRAAMAVRIASNRMVADLGWDPRLSVRTYAAASVTRVLLPALNVTALSTAGTVTGSWGGVATGTDGTPPTANMAAAGSWIAPVTWSSAGSVQFRSLFTGVITYTAGWDSSTLPPVFADVILDGAAAWLDNPRGLASYMTSVGAQQEQVSYSIASTSGGQDPRLEAYRMPGGIG